MFVAGVVFALLDIPSDGWYEREPGDEVADQDGDESKTYLNSIELILVSIEETEGLNEHEDQGVAETRQEGQREDNGLGQEHLEWSSPSNEDLFDRESLLERCDLVGTPDVFALGASLLCDFVHHDGRPGFGYEKEMSELDCASKDELNPDTPSPVEFLLRETTDNGTENGASDGREDDEGDGVLLIVRFPHVCNHAQGDGSSGRRYTAKRTTNHDGGEVRGECDGELPEVDQAQRELEDRLPTEFLAPRCPQLASESVEYEEDHGTASGCLLADGELLGYALDRIRVQTGVEVHGDLDEEDDAEDGPLLPGGKAEAQFIVAVILCDFAAVVALGFCAQGWSLCRLLIVVVCSLIFGGGGFGYGVLCAGSLCQLTVIGGEVGDLRHGGRGWAVAPGGGVIVLVCDKTRCGVNYSHSMQVAAVAEQ